MPNDFGEVAGPSAGEVPVLMLPRRLPNDRWRTRPATPTGGASVACVRAYSCATVAGISAIVARTPVSCRADRSKRSDMRPYAVVMSSSVTTGPAAPCQDTGRTQDVPDCSIERPSVRDRPLAYFDAAICFRYASASRSAASQYSSTFGTGTPSVCVWPAKNARYRAGEMPTCTSSCQYYSTAIRTQHTMRRKYSRTIWKPTSTNISAGIFSRRSNNTMSDTVRPRASRPLTSFMSSSSPADGSRSNRVISWTDLWNLTACHRQLLVNSKRTIHSDLSSCPSPRCAAPPRELASGACLRACPARTRAPPTHPACGETCPFARRPAYANSQRSRQRRARTSEGPPAIVPTTHRHSRSHLHTAQLLRYGGGTVQAHRCHAAVTRRGHVPDLSTALYNR